MKHAAGRPFPCTENRIFMATSGRQARSFLPCAKELSRLPPVLNYSKGKSNTAPPTATLLLVDST